MIISHQSATSLVKVAQLGGVMTRLTRRDLLKTSAVATTATAAGVTAPQAGVTSPVTHPAAVTLPREKLLLDFGWRFHLGHACDPAKDFGFGVEQNTFAKAGANVSTAALPAFDDSGWAAIALPHDWAVDLPFVPSVGLDPTKEEDPRSGHGFKPLGRAYPETSVGWYRRVFDLPAEDLGRRIALEFDGVFRDAVVIFNGHVVARNASGYVSFRADVTDFAVYGGKNVLLVRVDATLGEGWFYEGAGIYRHVWLTKTDPLHIAPDGVVIRSEIKNGAAVVSVMSEIANEGADIRHCSIISTIRDPQGRVVKSLQSEVSALAPQESRSITQSAALKSPALWSLETPNLYQVITEIVADGRTVDGTATKFGIRTIHFDPDSGFFLNGKPVKLKGTCNHQDHAGLGSALPDRVHAYRVERLKEMGSNAYRTSHNPPAPELLDACDRLGMVVIDETRMMSSDPEGISQLTRMIRRDRNHPSIIIWSIGNEEFAQQGTELGARIARSMKRVCNALDPTRLITAAMDQSWGQGISPVLDVVGFNYRTDKIDAFHKANPHQPTMGTETASTVCTRGIYARDPVKQVVPAYDTDFPWWASTAESWWNIVANRPFIAGGFVWTGFDYRGEPTPFNKWPSISSQFGILDTCGFPKDNFYYYKAWWDPAPLVHLLPHWNWQGREGQVIKVWCHSNLDSVELFLNGKSFGMRTVVANNHVEWDVPYAPGVLEARGFRGGQMVLTDRRETTGAPAAILLSADRPTITADGEDVAVITVMIVDARGRMVPTANNGVAFSVSASGVLIGVGNGDPNSHESDKAPGRAAFNGLCAAIVQGSKQAGQIRVDASSPGLSGMSLTIDAKSVPARPFVA